MADLSQPAERRKSANPARTRALVGMEAPRVTVETHLPGGLPGFTLVGLPETAVREARDRVKSAIQNCNLEYPQGRIVVNLAPAELAKEGARFDLAIAISILRATRQLPARAGEDYEFLGELGLFGELRATRGCLCAALALARDDPGGRTRLIIPARNATEARLAPERLLPANHLLAVVAFLRDPAASPLAAPGLAPTGAVPRNAGFSDIIGQASAKRALTIAAAGAHHLLLVGPPGAGKTLLASRLADLLPALPDAQAMEVAAAYSAAAMTPPPYGRPPLRNPHHSASAAALTGGGRHGLPGEISLAHRGVLFLDELPHFKPGALDALREPLEARRISIARATYRADFPAHFQLVAAMNPCPAGRTCSEHACRCSPDQVRRYQGRISGPLLDRIDLHVAVPPVPQDLVVSSGPPAHGNDGAADEDATPAQRIAAARQRQMARQGCPNADIPGPRVVAAAQLDGDGTRLLTRASEGFALSARGVHRVLRTARTIADLAGDTGVGVAALSEALSYRALDWEGGLNTAAR